MIELPSHKPAGYRCPFCAIADGAESEFTAWRDEHVLVQIALHWNPANPGKALVIPLAHIENIYTLPDELAGRIAHMVRRVAVAIRTGYPCDGVTVRQNNEPAGGQDVWHLHTHVIPRYLGDGMRIWECPCEPTIATVRAMRIACASFSGRTLQGFSIFVRMTTVPARKSCKARRLLFVSMVMISAKYQPAKINKNQPAPVPDSPLMRSSMLIVPVAR